MNILLAFILHKICLCKHIYIENGYLCEGKLEMRSSQKVLKNVMGYICIRDDKGIDTNSYNYLLKLENRENIDSFSYIIDNIHWQENISENFLIYNIFEFTEGDKCLKIPGIYNHTTKSIDTQISKKMYEIAVMNLSTVLVDVAISYVRNLKNQCLSISDEDNILDEQTDEFNPRVLLVEELRFLRNLEKRLRNTPDKEAFDTFKSLYTFEMVRSLIGDTNQGYSMDDLVLYTQRCYDFLNMASSYLNKHEFADFVSANDDFLPKMTVNPILTITFDFVGSKTTEEKTVNISDIFFMGRGGEVSVNPKDLKMYKDETYSQPKFIFYIECEKLRKAGVEQIIVKNEVFKTTKEISEVIE